MASKVQLVLIVFLVAGATTSALAKHEPEHATDLLTALTIARKTLGGPVRKQLAFVADSQPSGTYGSPSPKSGTYPGDSLGDGSLDSLATASPPLTSSPALASDRSASLSGGSTTSGSQTAATTEKSSGNKKNPSGSTAAAVVGTLIGLAVVGVLSLFAWKQWKKSQNNNQRYSTYSTFDNEMGVRYRLARHMD